MDSKEFIYVCPSCGAAYSNGEGGAYCWDCKIPCVYTGYTSEAWFGLSNRQQDTVIQQISPEMTRRTPPETDSPGAEADFPGAMTAAQPASQGAADAGSGFWINFLNLFINIALTLAIMGSFLGGFIYFTEGESLLGLAIVLGGILVSLLSSALIKIFIQMARDIRIIRISLTEKEDRPQ